MNWPLLVQLLLTTAATSLALVLLLWLISMPLRDISIIDMAFSALVAGLIVMAWYTVNASGIVPGLIVLLSLLWAARMTIYLVWRNWGHGEDVRYTRLRSRVAEGWPFHWLSLRKVFLLQGSIIWVLTLPQRIAMLTGSNVSSGLLTIIGVLLWCLGFLFESIGDFQLTRFKSDPARQGQVLNTGLWRYTRHPNYFGELCQWWGLFLIAAQAPWAWCGIIGPLLYSWLVINVTGQRTLDKKLAREKPGYAAYMETTSGLIPRRPR